MVKSFKPIAVSAARSADDRKAEDIRLFDVRKTSPVVDFMIIATVHSRPQMEAVEKKIVEDLSSQGHRIVHRARPQSDQWRVLDYGGLMVHVMSPEARTLYALERLHPNARTVVWKGAVVAEAA